MMKALEQLQAVIGVLLLGVVVFVAVQRSMGRARRKRTTKNSNLFEVFDEVFSPARHTATSELRTHQDQGPVTPVPDPLLAITSGHPYLCEDRKAEQTSTYLLSGAPADPEFDDPGPDTNTGPKTRDQHGH